MILRLVVLAIAQAFDLATFHVMVTMRGSNAEANPLVKQVLESSGLLAVVLLKVALVILVAALVVAAVRHAGGRTWAFVGGIPLAIAIAVGLIGGITNAATILK